MKYTEFKYLYPPRPEVKTPATSLATFETGEYIAQPKYNGSCCVVFTNGEDLHVCDRHKQLLASFNSSKAIEFKKMALIPGKWYVYAGEYLNKGKTGESGEKEKDKFILWDVLVFEGEYLIGSTMRERIELLETHFPCKRAAVSDTFEMYEHLCTTQFKGIYKAPTYMDKFTELWSEIVKVDLYEGLVLKKLNSKLTYGHQPLNNQDWQIKCRKETKLYKF